MPDCVVISVPAEAVLDVVSDAAAAGIRAAFVISEGFADAATDAGRARQDSLVRIARAAGMAIAGPNCMGITSLHYGFAATMADVSAAATWWRHLARLAKRRAARTRLPELTGNRGIGVNYLVSSGNEADLAMADYIGFLADDPATKVIACIMEGAKDGQRFRAAVTRAARAKPMVVLKLGRSEFGQRATLAHTGTLAGRHEAFAALFRQNGVALVDSIDALVETAALFDSAPLPAGDRVVMMTVSGGATSLIGDLGEAAGVNFPPIAEATNKRVQQILGVERAFGNPLDTVGLPRLRRDGNITAVLAGAHRRRRHRRDRPRSGHARRWLGFPSGADRSHGRRGQGCAQAAPGRLLHVQQPDAALARLCAEARPPADRGFGARPRGGPASCVDYARFAGAPYGPRHRRARCRRPSAAAGRAGPHRGREQEDPGQSRPAGDTRIPGAYRRGGGRLAAEIGGPVALKIQSVDIPHKSDVGGVHLGARTPAEIEAAAHQVLANAARNCPGAKIDGVLVQEMVADGVEFILGMTYDPTFGPLIVCGAGGVTVELFKDAAVLLPPVERDDVIGALASLKVAKLLDGFRGAPPRDRDALVECCLRFADFAVATAGALPHRPQSGVCMLARQGVRIADALIETMPADRRGGKP